MKINRKLTEAPDVLPTIVHVYYNSHKMLCITYWTRLFDN